MFKPASAFKQAPAMLTAFAMSAALLTNSAAAQNSDVHQWSDQAKSEFTIPNVRTKLLFPEKHYVMLDVHVDCDLMIDANGKAIVPVGFIGQFNAESAATIAGLAPGTLEVFENWKGSLDYRTSSQRGVFAHMNGQHEIDLRQVAQAGQKCWTEFRGNAVKFEDLSTHGSHHNDYK